MGDKKVESTNISGELRRVRTKQRMGVDIEKVPNNVKRFSSRVGRANMINTESGRTQRGMVAKVKKRVGRRDLASKKGDRRQEAKSED